MLKKIVKSNYKYKRGIFLAAFSLSSIFFYKTDYLDDAKYLLGGIYRGIRCATVGGAVAYTYFSVILIIK